MQQVSVYGCGRMWEQFHSWVCFLGYWLPHTTPSACLCSVLTFRHFQEVFRAFIPLAWSLLVFPLSSGHPQPFRWAWDKKLFYLQPRYYSLYMICGIYKYLKHQGACKVPQICCNTLKSEETEEVRPAENLGHSVTVMHFSMFIQLLITSVVKEKHWIKWVKMWNCRIHV